LSAFAIMSCDHQAFALTHGGLPDYDNGVEVMTDTIADGIGQSWFAEASESLCKRSLFMIS
jgi:hypothetical protein